MSSMFIKRNRRNYRNKAYNSDDENPDYLKEPVKIVDEIITEAEHSKEVIKKSRSVLSFEDDLDPVKKTLMSRKITKQMKESKKKLVDEIKMDDENNDKETTILSVEYSLEDLRKQLSDMTEDDPLSVEGKAESESSNNYMKTGMIPDAATIYLARKQREKAKTLIESSKVSPDHSSKPYYNKDNNTGRRIIREEDEDDDFSVFDENNSSKFTSIPEIKPSFVASDARTTKMRKCMSVNSHLNQREANLRALREDFLSAEHGSDRDSDQEKEWERQQLQKAMINQNPAVLEAIQPHQCQRDLKSDENYQTFCGIDVSDITLAKLKHQFEQKYMIVRSSLAEHKTSLNDSKCDLERTKQLICESREKLPDLAKRFVFYQEMNGYIDDLLTCFNEKMSKIEYMEKRVLNIFKERYKKIVDRRRLDMKDMADMLSQPANVGQKNTDEQKIVESRRRRIAERESRRLRRQRARDLQVVRVVELHIDGTSTDDEESQGVVAKRDADLQSLSVDINSLFDDVVEEFCELPLIIRRFEEWRNKYLESYQQAYVALCMPQLLSPLVRIELIQWNPLMPKFYSLEKMKWFLELLDFSCISLKTNDNSLLSNTINGNLDDKKLTNANTEIDENVRIIPGIIEKIVLPRLEELVSALWDPLSLSESNRLLVTLSELCKYPTVCMGSRSTERLFTAIIKRIEYTIQEDIFIPLYSKTMMTTPFLSEFLQYNNLFAPARIMHNRQSRAFQFFKRQFEIGMKLLKSILLWQNILSDDVMKHLTLTCLINRYLLVGLACLYSSMADPKSLSGPRSTVPTMDDLIFCDTVERLKSIVELLPYQWFRCSSNPKTGDDNSKSTGPDPINQIKRFIAQLNESQRPNCISSSSSSTLTIERDSFITNLEDLMKYKS